MTCQTLGSVVVLSVLMTLFAGTHAGHAQSEEDDTLKGMPKEQQERFSKFLDLSKQHTEAIKTKNPVAKKEAMEKVATDTRQLIADFNDMLAKDGAKDWIGEAAVLPNDYLTINFKSKNPSLTIHFAIPTKDMQKETLDVVKKLARGDRVKFTITADERNPAKMVVSKPGYTVNLPPTLLKSLTIAGTK